MKKSSYFEAAVKRPIIRYSGPNYYLELGK